MKTTVVISDEDLESVSRLAKQMRRSQSHIFSVAVREYLARHLTNEVTDAMNGTCEEVGDQRDPFVNAAAFRILARTDW